ncbi:dihydroorotase [Parablastomonas sp. CN1-191]|uniref:dihydroorotase n=1 Tax=Parablastomonas sp. CN1-191 TaxID=3400908 RepID=UPI003BF7AEC0
MRAPGPLAIVDGVFADGSRGALRCENGRIVAVGAAVSAQPGDVVVAAAGALLAPALVDFGVFAVDRPAFHFGGIVRAALMPDQDPPLDHPARIRFAAQSGKPGLWVHPLAAATQGLAGTHLAELALMHDAGARAVATGRRWIADTGVMHRLLAYAAMLGLVVVSHAEDSGLTGGAVATAGEMATRLGLPSAPAEAEALAAARDIALAELTGARLHIRQVTTAAALDLVRAAKRRGVAVTAGITPAHFALSETALGDFRTFARLSPPLRSERDRHAVRAALADGTLDVIASGHDPRGPEDKRLPFADAAPGMAGAETLLPLTLQLVRDQVIDLPRAFALLAANPARLLGVEAGHLLPGYEADLAVIDAEMPWIVDSDQMASSAGNTPFDKLPVQGRVTALWKGGVQVG